MRKCNVLLFTFTGLFLLICLLVQFRVQLAEFAIPRILPTATFSSTNLELESIDSNQARLSLIETGIITPQGAIHLESTGVSIDFTLRELKRGILQGATINTLTITLPPLPESTPLHSLEDYIQKLTNTLEKLKKAEIPVRRLRIKELLIKNGPFSILGAKPASLLVELEDKVIDVEATLPVSVQEEILINLQRTENGSIKAEIRPSHREIEQNSRLNADVSSNQIEIDTVLAAEDIKRFIPLRETFPVPHQLEIKAMVKIEREPSFAAEIHAEHLDIGKIAADHLQLQLNGRLNTIKDIHLEAPSNLLVEKLNGEGLQARSILLNLTGDYHLEEKNWRGELAAPVPLQVAGLTNDKIKISTIKLEAPLKLQNIENGISISPSPKTTLQLDLLNLNTVSIPRLKLSPLTTVPLQVKKQNNRIGLTGPDWNLSPIQVNTEKVTLHSAPLMLRVKTTMLSELDILMEAVTPELWVITDKLRLPLKDIQTRFRLKDEMLKGTINLRPKNTPGKIKANIRHDQASTKGGTSVTTTEAIEFSNESDLSSLVQGLNLPFTLTGGSLKLNAETRWRTGQPLRTNASIRLEQGAGRLKQFSFSGLELETKLQLTPALHSQRPGRINLSRLDTPVPLLNISIHPSISRSPAGKLPTITVHDLRAQVFDGRVLAPPFSFDLNRSPHHLIILAEDVALPRVLELLKVKGLEVEGRMNGRIPLQIEPGKVSVAGGVLTGTEEGGVIRYRPPDTGASQSPFTAYAMKALEEFHFSKLSAPVTYNPDGTLLVDLQLQGRSPRLETTRPVHLNIHTEQNLLSLLKSLQYSKVFTKELDKQLQRRP